MRLASFALLGLFLASTASAQIYVSVQNGPIAKFDMAGNPINTTFITGSPAFGGLDYHNGLIYAQRAGQIYTYDPVSGAAVNAPLLTSALWDFTISGNTLFAAEQSNDRISTFNANTGATINSTFINVFRPYQVLENAGRLYVSYDSLSTTTGRVAVYDSLTGTALNTALITGLDRPHGLALKGNTLYVSEHNGTIGTYNAITGAPINASFITGLGTILEDLVIDGNKLYVTDSSSTANVSVYDATTGAVIDATFISGLPTSAPTRDILILPEPATLGMIGGTLFIGTRRRR